MSKIWEEIDILNDNSEIVKGTAPVIISASRATDIPAFFSKWFFHRLEKGYIKWNNPFNRTLPYYISFKNTRMIVFWTKNAEPIIEFLPVLEEKEINYYFQFTLNDYVKENLEPNVPKLEKRIETFINLSEKIGKEKVIWRFDPLILLNHLTIDDLLDRIERIAEVLIKYTNKLVFSFIDIENYSAVQKNISRDLKFDIPEESLNLEFSRDDKIEFAEKISQKLKKWSLVNQQFELATCAEGIELDSFGIKYNKCIDDDLMYKLFKNDLALMNFIGYETNGMFFDSNKKKLKDKGQRKECGCIISKDIGEYNTCPHNCTYCYANSSKNRVAKHHNNFDFKSESLG